MMDLKGMLNSAPAPEKKPSQTLNAHTTPKSGASQLPATPDGYARNMYSASPASQQQTPMFNPPSRQGSSMTPLQTPSQYPQGPQYPFPPATSQRPSTSQSHKRLSIQSVLSSPAPPATEEHDDNESVSPKTVLPPRLSQSQSSGVDHYSASRTMSQESMKQEPSIVSRPSMEPPQPPSAYKKRSAGDAELDDHTATPQKQRKLRKYTERPPWARLARSNPHYKPGCNDTTQPMKQAPSRTPIKQEHPPALAVNGHNRPQPNGHHQQHRPAPVNANLMPWQHETPIDLDLLKAREVFGQWEKSFQWYTPMPDIEAAVMDWLVIQLSQLQDVGHDPREGSIEIEAKIGRVLNKATDERIQPDKFPSTNMSVLREDFALHQTRFESEMEMKEHKAANEMLNAATKASHQNPGRAKIEYRHLYETDSFQKLSALGIQALPQSLQKRNRRGRELSVRTTRNTKTGEVVARIVKVHIADLHIYNPRNDYDCRITINVECNLLDCALSDAELVDPPAGGLEKPSRQKDRLSYKHLGGIFSIDLTQVGVAGLAPKHELEVEVDAGVLRAQLERMRRAEENAFHDVVGTFLGNVTILMRMKT